MASPAGGGCGGGSVRSLSNVSFGYQTPQAMELANCKEAEVEGVKRPF